jgi:hypothetical protein
MGSNGFKMHDSCSFHIALPVSHSRKIVDRLKIPSLIITIITLLLVVDGSSWPSCSSALWVSSDADFSLGSWVGGEESGLTLSRPWNEVSRRGDELTSKSSDIFPIVGAKAQQRKTTVCNELRTATAASTREDAFYIVQQQPNNHGLCPTNTPATYLILAEKEDGMTTHNLRHDHDGLKMSH